MSLWDWSTDANSNTTVDGININNNCNPGNIDNGLRAIMANVRAALSSGLQTFLSGAAALPIASGGTGATTKAAALAALGAASAADIASAVPSGAVFHFARTTAPSGYLECNGAAVSRTTYANLFAAIGTTFGAGNGSTTFNLPNLRGEFIRGWDNGRGVDSGRVFGSAQADELESHTHTLHVFSRTIGGGTEDGDDTVRAASTGVSGFIDATGGTETRPRNIALLSCIKI